MPGALVTRFISAIEAKDLDAAAAMVSDDLVYDNVPVGIATGPDGLRGTLGPFMAGASEVDWVVHRQTESGDLASGVVMNERVDRFRFAGGWLELPVAGVFVIEDGVITVWRDFIDLGTMQQQLAATSG